MIPNSVEEIVDGLSNLFTINVFIINKDGIIQWANEHMLKEAKVSKLQEVQGKHARLFGEKSWLATKSVIISQKKSVLLERVHKKKFITIKIPYNNEEFRGVIGLSFDITALEKAENAKQAFLSNMSHDLRTPLIGLLGFAELLAKKGTTELDREYGHYIHQAGKQLLELLNSVLAICALENPIDPIKEEKIDLALLVNEVRDLLHPALSSKDLNFQVKLDKLPLILSDSIKLKRILGNLLSNAIKFTHEGEITLVIKLVDIHNDKVTLEIQVTDTGIGIPKDHLKNIFNRFYRIEPSYQSTYKGNGLGLYLVKENLSALGGKIDVKSEEGKGSSFTITLHAPLVVDYISQGLVLIVEAEELNSRITKKLLESLNYSVVTKSNGEEALEVLQQTQEFDWVLMDINLPDIEGVEVVKRYRQWEKRHNKPQLPIFAYVPDLTQEIRKECLSAGFTEALNKPLTKNNVDFVVTLILQNCVRK